ncbi:MAG TPA: arylesterase [Blastocatellia bacterium]|nr:arylesterase [Blastocatellia bacterium]
MITGLAACGPKEPSAPAEAARPEPPRAPDASPKSVAKIVAFGDSLTAGYGLPASESYPALLQKKLEADGFNYEVVNAGVSGDTSAGGLRRIDWALEGDVKFVIVELGANDILRGQPVPAMKKNLSQIIERVKARGAQVVLAGMEAPTNAGVEYRREVQEAYRDLARQYQVPYIPFFLERVAMVESLNQGDGVHPNAAGTKIVAETVYQTLRPLLEEQKSTGS